MDSMSIVYLLILCNLLLIVMLVISLLANRRRDRHMQEQLQRFHYETSLQRPAVPGYVQEGYYSHGGMPTGARVWHMELIDVRTGARYNKFFQGSVTLGRRIDLNEPTDQMYLGTDHTISRRQCYLFDTHSGVMISNLSSVNITRQNGRLLQQPGLLQRGDILEAGNERYVVNVLQRTA